MQAHAWGIKTFYYSLMNKQGAKAHHEIPTEVNGVQTGGLNGYHNIELSEDDDCEACKL